MIFTPVDKQIYLESGLLLQIRTISGPLSFKKFGIGPKSGKSDLSVGTAKTDQKKTKFHSKSDLNQTNFIFSGPNPRKTVSDVSFMQSDTSSAVPAAFARLI